MKQIAAYCRVSTDKKDQANSFSAQQRFFRAYIEREQGWQLYEVYADEGITGTSTNKRIQFQRMLADAQSGCFQLIITKEVSRFARNTLDALFYTRELKRLDIGVIFLNDGICTLDSDAELRLSILGSIAQEESRRTSQRVKWGQTRQMEQGIVFGHSLLGYDLQNGVLTVEPKGAELVKLIFNRYAVEKHSSVQIAQELIRITQKDWSAAQVIRVLKNEKYVGDLIQKKTYTPDYLTHEKKRNTGEEPLIILQNHHPPIIDRSLWERAQAEILKRNRRKTEGEYQSDRYCLSGKIHCGQCGSIFIARTKARKDGTVCRRWRCRNSGECTIGKTLNDETTKKAVLDALYMLLPEMAEPDLTDDIQETIIRALVDCITVFPDKRLELRLVQQRHPIVFFFV